MKQVVCGLLFKAECSQKVGYDMISPSKTIFVIASLGYM